MAEGGGLLNRYRINSPIVGSNPIPSAIKLSKEKFLPLESLGASGLWTAQICPKLKVVVISSRGGFRLYLG